MLGPKIKKNGQGMVGGILLIVLLIALVIFIFYLIRRPEGPSPPEELAGIPETSIEAVKEEIAETREKFPIAEKLPYGGPFDNKSFFIHDPTPDGKILIDIDIDTAVDENEAKNEAMDWIQYQGYNPDDYDFVFRAKAFPKW